MVVTGNREFMFSNELADAAGQVTPSQRIAGEKVTMRDLFQRPEYVQELKEVEEIMNNLHKQRYEMIYNRVEPFGIMLDRVTYRKLMHSRALIASGTVVPQHYSNCRDCSRIMGLVVSIIESNNDKQFIKVVS